MLIVNPNVIVLEGGFVEAIRYALENKACFVMAVVEVPADQLIDLTSEALMAAAFKELGMTDEELSATLLENTVQLNLGGYQSMSVDLYAAHINEITAGHEAPSVVFVSEPEMVKALVPGVTLQ